MPERSNALAMPGGGGQQVCSAEASAGADSSSGRVSRVAGALAGAGLIHLALIPRHFAESLLFGASFTAIAAFQGGIALALLSVTPKRRSSLLRR